ncbi:MAG: LptF/LptG family permease [Bacteroidales bacterium]|nr:LptF/LptG family permease [Bacteroidales bacterium]
MNFKITILDRYIIKKFIGTFFVALLLIIFIVIIFDISEKIDDFVDSEAPIRAIAFEYYLNFVPYFVNMFSPLFVFITVIFFTSKLAGNSEFVAMLSGGISFGRLMYPYFISSLLIASFSLILNLFIIPSSNVKRIAFEEQYIKDKKYYNTNRNIHYQIAPGEFVYVESFSTWNNTAYKFTLESTKESRLVSKLTAESAVWDSTMGGWKLKNYTLRDYTTSEQKIIFGKEIDTVISLKLDDFYRRENTVEALTYNQLEELIKMQKLRGDSMVKYSLIEKNTRFAVPFSAFILTLIGVSLSSKKRRGGIGLNLGVGIALSFSYILFLKFSQMFVITDTLPPWIALWLPNVIFAVIAVVLYRMAPK